MGVYSVVTYSHFFTPMVIYLEVRKKRVLKSINEQLFSDAAWKKVSQNKRPWAFIR